MPSETKEKNGENRKLTRAERAVLAVLVNPDFFKSDNAARIEASGVSPSRFYEVIADPWFQDQSKRAFLDIIRGNVGPVVQASIDTAAIAGRDGHQDRKMLLEMAGMYVAKQRNELTGENGGPIVTRKAEELTDDELALIASGRRAGTVAAAEGA